MIKIMWINCSRAAASKDRHPSSLLAHLVLMALTHKQFAFCQGLHETGNRSLLRRTIGVANVEGYFSGGEHSELN
ncbi:hypothetical protein KIN20_019993 [Parelaphostrongylus tenuis]|uniref:Uncharacterized protein n=1 Tax=Parelaphostrongylus tenuis TaxID=148309 RepID=A0AAD5N2T4_PARTN|nr:hypothetical protein KIN20_019993 [Parelaphostrongylus tenuis]